MTQPKGRFDRLATFVDDQTSRAWFFALCLVLVAGWLVLGPLMGLTNPLWHLLLNSPTTGLTFLLVALGANTARRDRAALHAKLDAHARALRDLMQHVAATDCPPDHGCSLRADIEALQESLGLEEQVGTKESPDA